MNYQPDVHIDPITLEILWTRLQGIAQELAATLVHTSFSTAIRLNQDFACAVFDTNGTMLAQHSNAPGQLGSMPKMVRAMYRFFSRGDLEPGDALITNDPWLGCGHTSDIYITTPIFAADDLVGFAVNSAHHMDIGGRLASHESREVFEEGLIIPPLKVFKAGQPNRDVFGFIEANVRFPNKIIGDVRAQRAANEVAARRVRELLHDYDLDGLEALGEEIVTRTEQSMRKAIAALPDGTFYQDFPLDEEDDRGEKLIIRLALTVSGDEIIADFEGTSAQVSKPINSVYNYTAAYTYLGVQLALAPELPANEGCHRPIKVVVPEANLLNAKHPIAVYWRTSVGLLIPEIILLALANVIPEGVMAGNGCIPRWHQVFSGQGMSGEKFLLMCHYMGGLGARYSKDGLSTAAWPSNILEVPAEVIEQEAPILVESKEFIPDSGGAGRHRGGLGQKVVMRNLLPPDTNSQPLKASTTGGRFYDPAVGLAGGLPGRAGRILVNDDPVLKYRQDNYLGPGDWLIFELPGGGGYFSPQERPIEQVAEDVHNGVVSVESARADYGVVIDPATGQVDVSASEQHRMKPNHPTERTSDGPHS